MGKRILVTGGCGFYGHHLVEHIIKNTDWDICIIDRLSYASAGFDRLRDINVYNDKRVKIFTHDLSQPIEECLVDELGQFNYIIHTAASTHVDNSVKNPRQFVFDNVIGTSSLLDFARNYQKDLEMMIMTSTDEVFGPVVNNYLHKEWDRYNSSNIYAATKAGAEELCLAYANTYRIPILIVHCMNLAGERQDVEKMIPKCIRNILLNQKIDIHCEPDKKTPGSRYYIHCRNLAHAMLFLLKHGKFREKYNIVGDQHIDNLELARMIANILDKPLKYELVDFHSARPFHDCHYGLDGTKMKEIGWSHPVLFKASLEKMIKWYLQGNNIRWLNI